jgi:transcriptional regulator with XRE-family HTH domain
METIFSNRLKELRQENNLTQKQLAAAIGTTDDSIYSWEKGRSEPNCDMICALCNFFEVSADFLLGRSEY